MEKEPQERIVELNKQIHRYYRRRHVGLSIMEYQKVTGLLLEKYIQLVRRAAKQYANKDLKEEDIIPKDRQSPIVKALEKSGCAPMYPVLVSADQYDKKERYNHFKFLMHEMSPESMQARTIVRKLDYLKWCQTAELYNYCLEEDMKEFLEKATLTQLREFFYKMCFKWDEINNREIPMDGSESDGEKAERAVIVMPPLKK